MSNIIDKIQLSGVTYDIGGSGSVSTAITSGDTNAVAGGAVYDKFDEVEQVTAAALNELNDKVNPTVELTQAQYDALVTAGTVQQDTYYIITDATAVDMANYYTTAQTNSLLSGKQSTLVSGTNIKTINNESILGSGNISVEGKGVVGSTNISVSTGTTNYTINFTPSIWAGTGTNSIKENYSSNTASGSYSHAEGYSTKATGSYSHAEGRGTTAGTGSYTHAEGYNTKASGSYSHAEGASSLASGYYSHAEGSTTTASGTYSHAEGYYTTASGQYSHAEGYNATASTDYAHAEGEYTLASGEASHAEGYNTTASTNYAHAEGRFTTAQNEAEHASGRYNVSSKANTTFGDSGNTLFSVGNGSDSEYRHNVLDIRQNGDIYIVDTSASGDYDAKPMIKLQDSLGGTVSTAITRGDTNAVAGGAVYDKFDEVEQVTAAALNTLNEALGGKQDTLSAGTNITIVDNVISAEGGGSTYTAGDGINITNDVISVTGKVSTSDFNTYSGTVDTALSGKQDTLVSGTNIKTINNESLLGSGNIDIQGGGGTVESAITSGSTNAVESKAIWSATTYNKEITLQWDNGFPSKLSTNYPSGCKKFVVTVPSNNTATIMLYNNGSTVGGNITITTWGSVTVSIGGLDGITYTTSGNDVTFVVPDTITFDQLQTDIRSITSIKAIVEGAWIADNTYMKEEVNAIASGLQTNINSKLDATAYTPVTIDSTLNVASTNPVENQALYSELRISNGGETETTLTFEDVYSTNYPEGCTKIKVEVVGNDNSSNISFFGDWALGAITINNWGSISVDTSSFQGATYEITGTTIIISYPTVTNVTRIRVNAYSSNYTYKAVTTGAPTALKDQVVANATALGGLSLVKLTQAQYDALANKDNSTLYVIVG